MCLKQFLARLYIFNKKSVKGQEKRLEYTKDVIGKAKELYSRSIRDHKTLEQELFGVISSHKHVAATEELLSPELDFNFESKKDKYISKFRGKFGSDIAT